MRKLSGKIVKAIRVKDSDLGRIVGQSLRALRELAGLTQTDLAARLAVGQAAVSKIENRGDVQISSLKKYVEALARPFASTQRLTRGRPLASKARLISTLATTTNWYFPFSATRYFARSET